MRIYRYFNNNLKFEDKMNFSVNKIINFNK